ncbi:MAG TPA: tripartite tricarboxylate transporter substrate binding protein [Symbiobacteriaceae bacterium]|nr:tripartite tricarboxylate transporter substrate binding protein [Symbiobacteriaceae bacterium]
MSRKVLALFALLSFSLFALLGCAKQEPTKPAEPAKAQEQAKPQEPAKPAFPTKALTILVPHAAGGGTDAVARALAKSAEPIFSQPITVVNKAGASGATGMTEGLNAAADGYTVTMATVEITLHPTMGNVPWKASDFKSVLRVNFDAAAITVPANSPYKTFEDFVKAAKEKPGALKVGASAPGTIWHLAALGLQEKTGAKFNVIPFPGGAAPAITDLLGGHLDAVTVSAAEVGQHVKAGKARILAVMAPERLKGFPDIATTKELGTPLDISTWRAFVVPGKTPDDVVKALHDGFKKAMEDPKFVEFMTNGGFGMGYMSTADFQKFMDDQAKLFQPLLEQAGLAKK